MFWFRQTEDRFENLVWEHCERDWLPVLWKVAMPIARIEVIDD